MINRYLCFLFSQLFFCLIEEFIWSQEEQRNMGAWAFIKPRFENMCGKKITYSGRCEGGTVAVGVAYKHKIEAENIIIDALHGL